jgi:acetoacetyl-[acyl-carrier protein] synthase
LRFRRIAWIFVTPDFGKGLNLMRLPVITGFGGINPAGRLSFHHGYKRMVIDALNPAQQSLTYRSLAGLMGVADFDDPQSRKYIRENTLIRRIDLFDPGNVFIQSSAKLRSAYDGEPLVFTLSKRQLPGTLPPGWQVESVDDRTVRVSVTGDLDALIPNSRVSKVSSAGQLPKGFNPGELYQSRNHPRGLQLAVYGASDALRSTGISIEKLKAVVPPDQMAVYSSSAMGQLDSEGYGMAPFFKTQCVGNGLLLKMCRLVFPKCPVTLSMLTYWVRPVAPAA